MAKELTSEERVELQRLVNMAAAVLLLAPDPSSTNLSPAKCQRILVQGRRYGILPQETVVETLLTVAMG